jgi:DNA-binding protein H-NS
MTREATITFEQVAAVAENIKNEGGKPTSRAVRERLGSGSMGTINRMLQDWKAGQERKIETALVLPAGLQRAMLDFMDLELNSARAQLRTELAEQQQEAADLAKENERQAEKIARLEEAIEERISDCDQKNGEIAQLYKICDGLREEIARERLSAESARTELAKALLRLEAMPRLEADLVELRAKMEGEHLARVAAEKAAAVAEAQKAGTDEMLEEVKAVATREKGELVKALEAARSEIIELKKPKADAVKVASPATTTTTTTKKAKPALLYRHPQHKKTWTGKGQQPQWVKDWLADGKTLEELEPKSL